MHRVLDYLLTCTLLSCFSDLNSNLNVPLDMGVGGGSGGGVSYKEPPQSRLKKLWATDPLEQTSKPGTDKAFIVCHTACCGIVWLSGGGIHEVFTM